MLLSLVLLITPQAHSLTRHMCCLQAPRELLSFLLKIKQIDVNERDNHGQTVLHFAASSDRWLTNTAALLEMKNIDVKVGGDC